MHAPFLAPVRYCTKWPRRTLEIRVVIRMGLNSLVPNSSCLTVDPNQTSSQARAGPDDLPPTGPGKEASSGKPASLLPMQGRPFLHRFAVFLRSAMVVSKSKSGTGSAMGKWHNRAVMHSPRPDHGTSTRRNQRPSDRRGFVQISRAQCPKPGPRKGWSVGADRGLDEC